MIHAMRRLLTATSSRTGLPSSRSFVLIMIDSGKFRAGRLEPHDRLSPCRISAALSAPRDAVAEVAEASL